MDEFEEWISDAGSEDESVLDAFSEEMLRLLNPDAAAEEAEYEYSWWDDPDAEPPDKSKPDTREKDVFEIEPDEAERSLDLYGEVDAEDDDNAQWYDSLTQPGKRNAAVGLVALLLVGGVAFWSTQQPATQKLPASGVATQGVHNETGAAVKDKKAQADSGENEKKKAEGNTKTDTEAGSGNIKKDGALKQTTPSENPASGNATKKAPPIVSSNKESVSTKAGNVQFSGSNWNVFQKTEQHLGPKVANADKVVYPPGQWPRITIQNHSDSPLKNPQAVLHFTDFGVVGSDLSVTDYNNMVISSKFADKGGNGVARTVTMRYDGTVPPHETYHLNLFGGIAGLFKTGANPSVRVVFSADNAENQEKFYTIIVR